MEAKRSERKISTENMFGQLNEFLNEITATPDSEVKNPDSIDGKKESINDAKKEEISEAAISHEAGKEIESLDRDEKPDDKLERETEMIELNFKNLEESTVQEHDLNESLKQLNPEVEKIVKENVDLPESSNDDIETDNNELKLKTVEDDSENFAVEPEKLPAENAPEKIEEDSQLQSSKTNEEPTLLEGVTLTELSPTVSEVEKMDTTNDKAANPSEAATTSHESKAEEGKY